MDQDLRSRSFASPVGVYGGFYAIRRELAVPQPAGMILDDMFQPLSIIRQGYRSVLDPRACVYDTWPKKIEDEFHRKVRTLAGNFQLFHLAPWTLTPRNPVFFQLFSHKVMRLVVPYLLVLLLVSTLALSRPFASLTRHSPRCRFFGWAMALAGCVRGFPCSIELRLQPARCWCSKRPPSPGFTNFFLRAARSGRYGIQAIRRAQPP